jgi:hypothetical protein
MIGLSCKSFTIGVVIHEDAPAARKKEAMVFSFKATIKISPLPEDHKTGLVYPEPSITGVEKVWAKSVENTKHKFPERSTYVT